MNNKLLEAQADAERYRLHAEAMEREAMSLREEWQKELNLRRQLQQALDARIAGTNA